MRIVADAHIPFIHEYFDGYGELVLISGRNIRHADLKDADILLVRSVTQVNEKLLANTRVKFVGSVTAGADHLDTKWLNEEGIAWSVATGFNAPPVADYVVSIIAALKGKGLAFDKTLKTSVSDTGFLERASGPHWGMGGASTETPVAETGVLVDKPRLKAAVIGVGNVGKLVVDKLKLLNFDVILCDPARAEYEEDFLQTPIAEIKDVDLISIHVPLTKTSKHPTYHFIDQSFLSQQKPGSVLLNASRGSVINSNDLKQYGAHLKWCFDVWEHEPAIDKDILAQALIATPHIAGYSIQSKIRGIHMIYRIACEKELIPAKPISPVFMQDQTLRFSLKSLNCYDIVLGIFNPLILTSMMRDILLPAKEYGPLFDEMRHQFNQRYEFAYTKVDAPTLSEEDISMLAKLGIRV